MSDLANQSHHQPMENAADVIERFGGIRPMAAKVSIAVTTIQGWKKRGVIPANRVETVLTAAKEQNIDLSDILTRPSENGVADKPVENVSQLVKIIAENQLRKTDTASLQNNMPQNTNKPNGQAPRHEEIYAQIKARQPEQNQGAKPKAKSEFTELRVESQRITDKKGVFISATVVALLSIGVVSLLWPHGHNVKQESLVFATGDKIKNETSTQDSMFKGLVPGDWNAELAVVKDQATKAATSVGETVQSVNNELMSGDTSKLQNRLVKVEKYASDVMEDPLGALAGRFESMRSTDAGEQNIDESMSTLHGMVMDGEAQGLTEEELNAKLNEARQQSPSLSETFTGVPQQDLKAAAMLLTMTQLRESLNRTGVPFDKDLETLKGVVGNDDPELMASLERLAPNAEQGRLTPTGISNEFRGLAGDLLSASLDGEDLSISERAKDRMDEVFRVEKNGEVLTGSQQKRILNETKKRAQHGGYEEAIKYIRSLLKSNEFEPLRPWLKELEAKLERLGNIIQKVQAEIDMGHLEEAFKILRQQLASKELDVLNNWIKKMESYFPSGSLEDAQNKVAKLMAELQDAIDKIIKGGHGGGHHGPGGFGDGPPR